MDLIKKSVNVIKSLQLPNGGILATPINEAYPYVYIRDAVIMTKALNKVGLVNESERFYFFIKNFLDIKGKGEVFHRYLENGLPAVTRKHQHDNAGLVLHGIYNTYQTNSNKEFLKEMWPFVLNSVKFIFQKSKKGLIETDTSIHEFYRLENGFEIWANSACCRGLYDAVEIADILGEGKKSSAWKKKAKQIQKNIKTKMFNKRTGLFMKNTKYPTVSDATQVAPFYFNIENSEKLLNKSIHNLQKELWYRELGGFRRFKKFEINKDWHWYSGGSGGWTIFTAWLAGFYRELNDKKHFKICKTWLDKVASRTNGLFPEHIATKREYDEWKSHEIEFNSRIVKGMEKTELLYKKFKKKYKEDFVYWATPLGWSHAEYILLCKDDSC